MRLRTSAFRGVSSGVWVLSLLAASACVGASPAGPDDPNVERKPSPSEGRALFFREWMPGEPSEHGGDGLGPVYNETSCIACHNQGGAGGAGGADKNVDLLTAVATPVDDKDAKDPMAEIRAMQRERRAEMAKLRGREPHKPRAKGEPPDRQALVALHPGFRDSSSVVLHHFGSGEGYDVWRLTLINPDLEMLTATPLGMFRASNGAQQARLAGLDAGLSDRDLAEEHGDFTLSRTRRNTTALYGAGLIDALPEADLMAAAQRKHPRFPEIKGRPGRLPDGRIGRFGWKAQEATLGDFVRTACAVELGLEVPGHHQGLDPKNPAHAPKGLDLTERECTALTDFVRSLPPPSVRSPATPADAETIRVGREKFERVGCATCHAPELGQVRGIYSDLLLHDMGDETSDAASYGPFRVKPSEDDPTDPASIARQFPSGLDAFQGGAERVRGASAREWRTPPLWGVRDSAPYLHDGRAKTLEQAIALHGGQAQRSARLYFALPARERTQVQAFLKSLVAPSAAPDVAMKGE